MRTLFFTIVCVIFACSTAYADDRETRATEIFKRGAAAYAKGDFFVAAQAFEEANAVLPAGAALYNAALAWEGAHEDLKAAVDFAEALEMGLVSASQLEDARKRLAVLDAKLAAIDLGAPGARSILVDETVVQPGHVRLLPGDHRIRATFEEGAVDRPVTLAPGTTTVVSITAPPKRETPAPIVTTKSPVNVLRIAGIATVSAAVVGAVIGIALGATGQGARDDFVNGGRIDTGLRDKAVSLQTTANVTFVASAIVGAIGVGLFTWSFVGKPAQAQAAWRFDFTSF